MRKLQLLAAASISTFLFLISCGDPLPIEDLVAAKSAITQAASMKADKYAADELKAATDKLYEAHVFVKDGDDKKAIESAKEAKKLADEAYNKACPLVARDTIDIAKQSLLEAESAHADKIASEEYQDAQVFLASAEQEYNRGNYKDAYSAALDADRKAKEARNVAFGRKDLLKDSIDEVRITLQRAEDYGAKEYAPNNVNLAEKNLTVAENAYADQRLKDGFSAVEVAKINADEAYLISLKATASKELSNAKALLSKAQESEEGVSESDELAAAQESYNNAEVMFADGRYRESIEYSKETALLANIVMTQQAKDSKVSQAVSSNESDDYFFYTVVYREHKKDCLWRIAGKYYDNPRKWKLIYNANKDKIKNPDLIYPGWVLKIPKIQK